MNKIEIPKQEWIIRYYSKSDGKVIKRPYDSHSEMQYEFIAKSTGKLCKRYFDAVKGETRTANAPWTITLKKKRKKKKKSVTYLPVRQINKKTGRKKGPILLMAVHKKKEGKKWKTKE